MCILEFHRHYALLAVAEIGAGTRHGQFPVLPPILCSFFKYITHTLIPCCIYKTPKTGQILLMSFGGFSATITPRRCGRRIGRF